MEAQLPSEKINLDSTIHKPNNLVEVDLAKKPLPWSSALPRRDGYYLGSEGKSNHLMRLGIIKSRIGVVSDIRKNQPILFWLVSSKIPNRVNSRWIIMLVEPCTLDPRTISGADATFLCLSQLTYLKFLTHYPQGKVVYVTDPLYDLSPVEAQKLNSLLWGNQLLKPGFLPITKHYDAVISAIKSKQPLVTWNNPKPYLKDTLVQNLDEKSLNRVLLQWNKIPTTVIVLERDKSRVYHVRSKLVPRVKHLKWFPAVDGQQMSNLTEKIKNWKLWVKPGLRTGQIGCALSHLQVWKEFLANSNRDPFMVVLEDDSFLVPDFDKQLQEILKELPFYFDWVYLYIFPKHFRNDEEVQIPGKNYLNKAYYTYCTVGYLISRQGAKKLTQRLKTIDEPLDEIICKEIKNHRLVAFSSKQVLVKNMGQQTSINKRGDGLPSNIWGTHYYVEIN